MTNVLDVVGLVALVVAGALVSPALGLLVLGVSCLAVSFRSTRARRGGGS